MIKVERKYFNDTTTLGELSIDGKFFCWTLEDCIRTGDKIYGSTAIPVGTYNVIVTLSNRFKKELPLLLKVPGFEGVRFHGGNSHEDTLGCILCGSKIDKKLFKISNCADVVSRLTTHIKSIGSEQLEIV